MIFQFRFSIFSTLLFFSDKLVDFVESYKRNDKNGTNKGQPRRTDKVSQILLPVLTGMCKYM